MMAATDWRDIEMDFLYKVYDWTAAHGITFVLGGGRHTNPQPYCEGCGYLLRIYWAGDTQMLKEQWHNNKVPIPYETNLEGDIPPGGWTEGGIITNHITGIREAWTIIKICRYNVKNTDGTTAVRIEAYLNTSGDKQTWTRFYALTDVAGWGSAGSECNGKADQVLNWGFPMIRIDWENATRVDWGNLHVREIQPQAPPPEDPEDPGEPEIPPAEQPTGYVEKIGSFRFSIASALATSCDGVEPTAPPQDPQPNPPEPPPPPGTPGTFTVYLSDYYRVGS